MKREPLLLAAAVAVGAAFLTVSLLVWLTRGRPWLVARKLRLGALLLGLTGTAAGCGAQATCYDPGPSDSICRLDEAGSCVYDEISVPKDSSVALTFEISFRQSSAFSFHVVDSEGKVELLGDLAPLDGAFDQQEEKLQLTIDGSKLSPGSHKLQFFNGTTTDVASSKAGLLSQLDLVVR